MKKTFLILALVFAAIGCKKPVVEKPKNLIEKEQMVNIIYDLTLLDAMKSQGYGPQQNYPTTSQLLKKKYKIDSLTFAQNSKYYAADVKNYKKMYEEVRSRLSEESVKRNGGKAPEPNADEGIVK